jgi:nicotinamide/nicotinate riboside kinase
MQSKEDQNCSGESGFPDSEIDRHRREIIASLRHQSPHVAAAGAASTSAPTATEIRICILEGFLLYPNPNPKPSPKPHPHTSKTSTTSTPLSPSPSSITALLDLKLFLRSTYALTRHRRQARPGYVTLEGFWEDPPGYVDEVVWPNYVREHGWMFEGGDVDFGEVKSSVVVQEEGIYVGPGKGEKGMRELLGWAVGVVGARVRREIEEWGGGGGGGGGDVGGRCE